jgi:cytochrome c556
MKRLACGAVMLTMIGIGLIPVGAAEEEVPTIKKIMAKLTKGKTSLTPKIGAELKKATPDWDTLQTQSEEYVKFANYMEQNDPPKGSKDEWKDVAKAFAVDAKELDDAVQKKEHAAAKVAHEKLAKSCMGCHKAFKGK